MTTLLEKAVSHVKKLTSEEQDAIAVLILEELEDEEIVGCKICWFFLNY